VKRENNGLKVSSREHMKRETGLRNRGKNASAAIALVILLMLSTSSAVVAAASSSVSIGSATVNNVGESVTLPLMLENAADEISCATILLSYDNAVAHVTSASAGGF